MNRQEQINKVSELFSSGLLSENAKNALLKDFPELAESEDKRMRNRIIGYLKQDIEEYPERKERIDEMLAYLEKQKEQKSIEDVAKEVSKDKKSAMVFLKAAGIMDENGELAEQYRSEQKPAIFVHKFRVGDKVISTKNEHLTYDVLEVGHINELGNPEYKVEIFADGKGDEPANIKYIECRKMDGWGKLIEQKPAEWSEEYREEDLRTRFAFYTYKDEDGVLYLSNVFVEEASRRAGFGTRILKAAETVAETIGATTIRVKVEQDSPANAWYRKNGYGYITFEKGYDWLEKNLEYMKSSKPAEWSDEDSRILYNVIAYVGYAAGQRGVRNDEFKKANSWLKYLPERFNLQPKQEWSEEDEEVYNLLNCILDDFKNAFKESAAGYKKVCAEADKVYSWVHNRLKPIRPQPHWKPSEEQMGAIKLCIDGEWESCNLDALESLYKDLKKLM
jgi:GNAT superfamily N-acetyltransferase